MRLQWLGATDPRVQLGRDREARAKREKLTTVQYAGSNACHREVLSHVTPEDRVRPCPQPSFRYQPCALPGTDVPGEAGVWLARSIMVLQVFAICVMALIMPNMC